MRLDAVRCQIALKPSLLRPCGRTGEPVAGGFDLGVAEIVPTGLPVESNFGTGLSKQLCEAFGALWRNDLIRTSGRQINLRPREVWRCVGLERYHRPQEDRAGQQTWVE